MGNKMTHRHIVFGFFDIVFSITTLFIGYETGLSLEEVRGRKCYQVWNCLDHAGVVR